MRLRFLAKRLGMPSPIFFASVRKLLISLEILSFSCRSFARSVRKPLKTDELACATKSTRNTWRESNERRFLQRYFTTCVYACLLNLGHARRRRCRRTYLRRRLFRFDRLPADLRDLRRALGGSFSRCRTNLATRRSIVDSDLAEVM